MDPEVIKKLCKFIPLLASDQDGEVVAAARAMKRTLEAKKLSFHDVVIRISAVAPERETPRPRRDAWGTSHSGFSKSASNSWNEMQRRMQEEIMREHQRMQSERAAKVKEQAEREMKEKQEQRHAEEMIREREYRKAAEDEIRRGREEQEARAGGDQYPTHDREEWLAKKIEVPRQQLIDECDVMLTKELSIKEQSFLRTLIGLTTKYHTILLSAKQHEWWQTMKMQHGV